MTEQTMNQAIEKLAENYNQLEQSLVNQLRLQVPNHQLTVGTYRERVWKSLFEMIIPKKYCIEQSVFIIDSYGNISREVDLAVYDEMYTPYIFNYGEIKFIPIEAVAVVVQCKSTIGSKAKEKEPPVDENGKTRETMEQNLEKWAKSITSLKTSLDSVTRTITDLVDNYDENLLNDEHNKNLTQTSTRPIRILCATKIHQSMMETLKEKFDILLYVEDIEVPGRKESFSKLTKVITNEKLNFIGWNNQLNHWGHERYDEQMKQIAYQNYIKERQQKQLRSPASLESRNLTQLRVTDCQEKENTILSLTFQLNQLLMFLNNPMLFPHRAYARMFTKNLGRKIQEEQTVSQYILAKYDVSGIQSYIFASRQLRENVGASQNVGRILKETLPGVLTEWAASSPDTVRTNWDNPKNWEFSLPQTKELQAEILYIGGGNAFVVYREETAYNQVSRLFAMKMMEQCQGVTVLSAHVEANPDNFPGDLKRLNQEMAQIKRRLRRPQPLSSYAVVEQDGFDGSPVTHLEIRGEASTKLSELRYEKRRDSLSNGAKTQPGRYALEMEDLAEQKGENSYIAVIHIDGNNMGELVQKLMDQNPTYETAVPAMRQLSAGIAQRNRQASEAMETAFASVFDRETLPLRPLIMDGDDMTFLCCCKAGIGAAVACLRRLLQLSDQKLPLSACAGIAFVHNHFPFSIAYDAAEACCSRAKNRWYQEKDDKTAYLDFQVVQGAFVKGLKDEAQLETLRVRPFRVAEKVDLRSEDSIDRLRQTLGRMAPDGGIQGQWPMTRLRRLYQAYRLGQDHVDLLKKEYASRGYTVSQLTGERAGVTGRKDGGIFDALETLDFYDGNIWRGFWEAVDKEDAL